MTDKTFTELLRSANEALAHAHGKRAVTLPLRKSMTVFKPIRSQGRAMSDAVRKDRKDRL